MMRNLRRLFADKGGSSVIEMALIAPLLATFLIGMVDLSRAYSAKLQVEQGAQRAVEKIQREGYQDTDTHKTALKAEAADGAGVESSAVTIAAWTQCNNAATKYAFSATCSGSEPIARYVSVTVTKTYRPMFSIRYAGVNQDGTYTVRNKAGVRIQ